MTLVHLVGILFIVGAVVIGVLVVGLLQTHSEAAYYRGKAEVETDWRHALQRAQISGTQLEPVARPVTPERSTEEIAQDFGKDLSEESIERGVKELTQMYRAAGRNVTDAEVREEVVAMLSAGAPFVHDEQPT